MLFKNISAMFLCLIIATSAISQSPLVTPVRDIQYSFISSDGTNASAVIWNPATKYYITVIAGNSGYPLEAFDSQGNSVFTSEAKYDWRGLWYNPGTKTIEGNGAGEAGWLSFAVSANNKPFDFKVLYGGQYQPDFQSVGTFNSKKQQVVFLNTEFDKLILYSRKDPEKTTNIELDWQGNSNSSINTTVGYTGVKGFEYVVLDYNLGKLIFFNAKGKFATSRNLPSDQTYPSMFAFSFANDRAFIYDSMTRIWVGYKVF